MKHIMTKGLGYFVFQLVYVQIIHGASEDYVTFILALYLSIVSALYIDNIYGPTANVRS